MKGASEFVTSFLTWFLGAILGEMVSSEVSHQMAKRGWTRKLCYWLVDRGSRTMPERYRDSYLEQAKAEIENLLVERRHLAALRVGISFITNLRFAYAMCYWVFCLTALLQVPFHISLFFKETSAPLPTLWLLVSGNLVYFMVYGISWKQFGVYQTGLTDFYSKLGRRSFRLYFYRYFLFPFLMPSLLLNFTEFLSIYANPVSVVLFTINTFAVTALIGGAVIPYFEKRLFHTS